MRNIGKMIVKLSNSTILFWLLALVFSTLTVYTWVAAGEFVVGWAAPAFSMLVVASIFTLKPSWQAADGSKKPDGNV